MAAEKGGATVVAAMAMATGKAAATGEMARMVGSEEVATVAVATVAAAMAVATGGQGKAAATGEVVRVEETVVAEKGEANMDQKPGHCKSPGHQMGLVR